MEPEMIKISRPVMEQMIARLDKAVVICMNARPMTKKDYADVHADCTQFYSGATGWSSSTMQDVLQTLETHLR